MKHLFVWLLVLHGYSACTVIRDDLDPDTHRVDPPFSYYSPGGTVLRSKGMSSSEITSITSTDAEDTEIDAITVVMNDFGTNLTGLRPDGTVLWRRSVYPKHPVGLKKYDEDSIVYVVGGSFQIVDAYTGDLEQEFHLPYSVRAIETIGENHFYAIENTAHGAIVEVVFDPEQPAAPIVERALPNVTASYARSLALGGTKLYIADTFGHKLLQYDLQSSVVAREARLYYPNDVAVIGNRELLVVEEHGNRILAFDHKLNPPSFWFGCTQGQFRDPSVDSRTIPVTTPEQADLFDPPKSICAQSHQGTETLYSPNGVYAGDGGLRAVADTDNHRVLILNEDGKILRETYGFNNPVKVVLIQD